MIGFAAGSASDVAGRVIAERLGKELGQNIVVENRPGAGGNIAAEAVAKAAPDGYTLLVGTGSLSTTSALRPDARFQPIKQLEPVALLATSQLVLVVSESGPFKDFDSFLKYAKANPNAINFGSTGYGGTTHLGMELMSQHAGIKLNHVPFNGSSQAAAALYSGSTQAQLDSILGAKQAISTGRARALAVSGLQRSPAMPNVPTFVELGLPKLAWSITVSSILAPKGVPPEILEVLNRQANKVVQFPEVQSRLVEQGGLTIVGGTRADFARELEADTRLWTDVIRSAGIKAE